MKLKIALILFFVLVCCASQAGVFDKDWSAVKIPNNCIVKQIATGYPGMLYILCEDGRVFQR
jgi:hypothetical protein